MLEGSEHENGMVLGGAWFSFKFRSCRGL